MIIKQNGLFYMTRRHYGTTIGLSVKKEKNEKVYSFLPGRVREDISVPEQQEDKKVEMVISAIKELMADEGSLSLIVKLYDQKIEFSKDESRYDMYHKIFQALIGSFGVNNENSLRYGTKKVLDDALKNGQIDVF